MSLTAGELLGLHIGGVGERWLFVVGGQAEQISTCDKQCKSGEVILSPSAWALIKKTAEAEVRPMGCMKLTQIITATTSGPLVTQPCSGYATPNTTSIPKEGFTINYSLASGITTW